MIPSYANDRHTDMRHVPLDGVIAVCGHRSRCVGAVCEIDQSHEMNLELYDGVIG